MEINTRRLKLRAITQQDFQAVHEYASDPETVKYMPFGPNTEKETQEFINRNLKRQQEQSRTDYGFGIILKREDILIGACGIHGVTEIQASIGYILNRRYWGHGYARANGTIAETAEKTKEYILGYGIKDWAPARAVDIENT